MPTAPAPFLRWAGGKRRLLPILHAAMPAQFGSFFEPFVGGGAVLFSLQHPGVRLINDANAALIVTYTVLRDQADELITALQLLAADTSAEAYYALRAAEPTHPVDVAARFIALNRMSFQGLFRVNRSGKMNTPYGHLKNPTVCDEALLRADSATLAGVTVSTGSYADAVAGAGANDFVYLDPPYIPLSATSSFTAYAADGFGLTDQQALADVIAELTGRGVHVMLSNSDTPVTRDIFAGLNLHTVSVRRSISAKASARGMVNEVLGVNYPLEAMADPAAFAGLATATV